MRGMMSPRLLRRICLDVLQRTPTPAEVNAYATADVAEVARSLLGTQEAMEVWLEEELFYFLLLDNFRPTNLAVLDLPRRLRLRQVDVRTAMGEILVSTGFTLRNPGNDTFVTVVLEQCLGLEVQDRRNTHVLEAGKRVYDGRSTRFLGGTGKTQVDVIKLTLADPRCTRHLLDRHHRRLFTAGLPAEAEAQVAAVHAAPATFFDVLGGWLASPRYADEQRMSRSLSHHQFARSLYHDLLGRAPTYDEVRMTRNAMLAMADPAPLRAVLVKIMLDSGKARLPVRGPAETDAAFVARCFATYLRRQPTADEAEAFAASPASRIVRALLTSTDYTTY